MTAYGSVWQAQGIAGSGPHKDIIKHAENVELRRLGQIFRVSSLQQIILYQCSVVERKVVIRWIDHSLRLSEPRPRQKTGIVPRYLQYGLLSGVLYRKVSPQV